MPESDQCVFIRVVASVYSVFLSKHYKEFELTHLELVRVDQFSENLTQRLGASNVSNIDRKI